MVITVETTINASLDFIWRSLITPDDVTHWNFASEDWCCPHASSHLQVGGRFNYRMEAKDGSEGFDFEGEFIYIEENKQIDYKMDDDRQVSIRFVETSQGVRVIETFDAEKVNPVELQQQGWQAILNNFKHYVESK
jgi:uncharacterized protein YndB with AHSA1/START domain